MILFNDLKASNERFREAFAEKLQSVLNSGQTILGDEVVQFEKSFADYCGTKHCIGVGNGLDALVLIFKGYMELGKLKAGDEVIISDMKAYENSKEIAIKNGGKNEN